MGMRVKGETEEARAVLLRFSVFTWTASLAGVCVTVMYLTRGARVAAAETVLMVLGIEAARRWTVRPGNDSRVVIGTHLWIAVGALAMVGNAVTVGQDQAITMWYFCAVPMLVAYLSTTRAATQWLFAALAAFLLVHSLHWWANVPQEMVPQPSDRLLGQVVMAVALYAFGVTQLRTVRRQMELIEAQAAELQRARDEALAASRAKSDFLANMSHELRTPLHGVIAALDLLKSGEFSPQVRSQITTALASADQASRVVNDILDFSRIEAGASVVEVMPFAFQEIVRQAIDVVHPVAEQKHLPVVMQWDQAVPEHVEGDAAKVRQIVVNLLGNAVKYTDEGQVGVEVTWHDGVATITVWDTGMGIDPATRDRLFEKFEQGDNTATRRYGGTGLGLAISKELAALLGGDLAVVSERGKGARFTAAVPLPAVEAPVATAPLAPLTALVPVPEYETRERGPEDGPLVLLVDDNPINAEIAGDILESLGCRSLWAPDGPAALEHLSTRNGFAAVLLDSHLPGMHGHEVGRRARVACGPGLPIILLTADVSSANLESARRAGVDLCLAKPARLATIRDALRKSGVIDELFDVRTLVRTRTALLKNRSDEDYQALARDLADVRIEARDLVERLRSAGTRSPMFQRAHANLVGGLLYASEMLEHGRPADRERRYLIQCLDRAIHWEDA
jgi:signal transduction histidine kinase/FixJ family two-component response regulator